MFLWLELHIAVCEMFLWLKLHIAVCEGIPMPSCAGDNENNSISSSKKGLSFPKIVDRNTLFSASWIGLQRIQYFSWSPWILIYSNTVWLSFPLSAVMLTSFPNTVLTSMASSCDFTISKLFWPLPFLTIFWQIPIFPAFRTQMFVPVINVPHPVESSANQAFFILGTTILRVWIIEVVFIEYQGIANGSPCEGISSPPEINHLAWLRYVSIIYVDISWQVIWMFSIAASLFIWLKALL